MRDRRPDLGWRHRLSVLLWVSRRGPRDRPRQGPHWERPFVRGL